MTFLCLGLAFGLTLLLGFVSHIQLLYLESIRIIRRETQSLQYFRETLASQIGLELEVGSLSFSLIKHVLLFLIGVFYLCTLVRPQVSALAKRSGGDLLFVSGHAGLCLPFTVASLPEKQRPLAHATRACDQDHRLCGPPYGRTRQNLRFSPRS